VVADDVGGRPVLALAARGQFCDRLNPRELPQALLDLFGGDARDRVHGLLRFLAPISGGAAYQERVP
jgi:hypothetical protein